MINRDFIQSLVDRTDIVEFIKRDITLKKTGANFVGSCPFHQEKTPSFSVSPSKQFYYCFGCGARGDVITFLMKKQNLEFIEAVENLANFHGVDIPRSSSNKPQKRNEFVSIYKILEQSIVFYQQILQNSQKTIDYLKNRNISNQTIQAFRLGMAPNSYNELRIFFTNSGFLEGITNQNLDELLIRGGLLVEDTKQNYDRFRNRLMIPIFDRRNRIIGYGGRALDDGEPKYLNSPENEIFHKSQELFGLNLAQKEIRIQDTVVVVEGYFDVISLHQLGITNVVATMGTAITVEQINILFKICKKIILCFDGDDAGITATFRAIERILPEIVDGKIVEILTLPSQTDPDKLANTNTLEEVKHILLNGTRLSEFLIQNLKNEFDDSSEGKASLVKKASPWIVSISKSKAPIFKNDFVTKIAKLVGLPSATVIQNIPEKISQKYQSKINPKHWLAQNRKPNLELILLREALDYPEESHKIITGAVNHQSKYYQCLQMIVDAYENGDFPERFDQKIYHLEQNGMGEIVQEVLAEIMRDDKKINTEDLKFRMDKNSYQTSKIEIIKRFKFLCDKKNQEGLNPDEEQEINNLLPKLNKNNFQNNYINSPK